MPRRARAPRQVAVDLFNGRETMIREARRRGISSELIAALLGYSPQRIRQLAPGFSAVRKARHLARMRDCRHCGQRFVSAERLDYCSRACIAKARGFVPLAALVRAGELRLANHTWRQIQAILVREYRHSIGKCHGQTLMVGLWCRLHQDGLLSERAAIELLGWRGQTSQIQPARWKWLEGQTGFSPSSDANANISLAEALGRLRRLGLTYDE